MTDPTPDRRAPLPPKIADTAALGYSAAVGIATVHWLIKCQQAGHMLPPDDALIEMWIPILLPTIHLLGRIVNNHLKKLAGESSNDQAA